MSDLQVTLGPQEENPYLQLGRAIAGQCAPGFEEARLDADLGTRTLSLSCTPEGGEPSACRIGSGPADEILSRLAAVRDSAPDEAQRGWSRCTVTLGKGGRFAMDIHG